MLEASKQELVRGFFENGVVSINVATPFTLASGKSSPIYFDHRRIFSFPKLRKLLTRTWATELLVEFEKMGTRSVNIAGTPSAGIAPAYALAEFLEQPFVYVRLKPKDHGTGKMIEGAPTPEFPYVVVDDMVTTGGSVLEACRRLHEEGRKILLSTSITHHDIPAANERFAQAGIQHIALFTSLEIFEIAREIQLISGTDFNAALSAIDSLK